MSRIITMSVLFVAAFAVCFASDANAETTHRLRLTPQPIGLAAPLPTFGFYSNLNYGYGYYVTGVTYYSAANSFGLQYGDVSQRAV